MAIEESTSFAAGFTICFQRTDFGYISVVAVDPSYQRLGLASALVTAAVRHLQSRQLTLVRIDAWEGSPAAVACYQQLGFQVHEGRQEQD